MKRQCPNCANESIPVKELILSDAFCPHCHKHVAVHWLYRAIFFPIVFVATLVTGVVVAVDQGLYAALLMVSVPIGAIGFIKARFSPLVVVEPRNASGEDAL